MELNQQLLQTIIALTIVLAAALVIIYKVVKSIKKPLSGCNSCSSDCHGCELTDLKKKK